MTRLEEIKARMTEPIDLTHASEDCIWLLSRLEIAARALEEIANDQDPINIQAALHRFVEHRGIAKEALEVFIVYYKL